MEEITTSDLAYRAFVRSRMYEHLAKSFLYPLGSIFGQIRNSDYLESLSQYESLLDAGVMQQCVREFMTSSQSERLKREELESEYNRLFAHLGSAKCPPYETEYGHENIFQKTQAMADIAGFYRAYGLEVADTNTERVDFIATELEFMSYLLMSETYARTHGVQEQLGIAIDTQKTFLRDHLGRWMEVFSTILIGNTENPFYHSLGSVVQQFVETELVLLGVVPERVSLRKEPHDEPLELFGCQDCAVPTPAVQMNESNNQFDV